MDGGVGRACRGAGPTDNLGSYFEASGDVMTSYFRWVRVTASWPD